MPQRNPVRLIRSLLVPQPPAEADALTWITGAPEVIRNARKNRGKQSRRGERGKGGALGARFAGYTGSGR